MAGQPDDANLDRAQVLALSVLLLDEDRAVALGAYVRRRHGRCSVLPFLQEAAMPTLTRAEFRRRKIELDGVRTRLATTLGVDEQELVKLRRVTWRSLLNAAMLVFAASALIGLLGGIDLEAFADSLRDANWWWLIFALLLAQIPRVPAAVSTMGAIERPLPLGPLTTLQFAISYVNLAVPSTAARVAMNIRFFQRFGVDATTAATAGAIDSVSGFIVQIGLFVGLFFWSDVDFGLSFDTDDLEGVATIALIVIVVAIVVLGVARVRRAVVAPPLHGHVAQSQQRLLGPALARETARVVRRQPALPGAVRGRSRRLPEGLRRRPPTVIARADQHGRVVVRRAAAGSRRYGRVRSRADRRADLRRGSQRDCVRHRARPTGSPASTCRRSGVTPCHSWLVKHRYL